MSDKSGSKRTSFFLVLPYDIDVAYASSHRISRTWKLLVGDKTSSKLQVREQWHGVTPAMGGIASLRINHCVPWLVAML